MNTIEVEVRSFVSKEQYDDLLQFFKEHAKLIKEDNQESWYFDGEQDLRIQRNDFFSKIRLKKWKIHDDHREEIEIKCDKQDFEKLEQLFLTLGFQVQIQWLRKRYEFQWEDMTVCIDFSKGYGYIIEIEKMTSEAEKEQTHTYLTQKLQSLHVDITPKEEFNKKFQYYKENWKTLIKE